MDSREVSCPKARLAFGRFLPALLAQLWSGHQLQAKTYTYLAGFSSYPTAEECGQEPTPGFLHRSILLTSQEL